MLNVTIELGEVEEQASLPVTTLDKSVRMLSSKKIRNEKLKKTRQIQVFLPLILTKSFSMIPVSRIPGPPCMLFPLWLLPPKSWPWPPDEAPGLARLKVPISKAGGAFAAEDPPFPKRSPFMPPPDIIPPLPCPPL